MKAWRMAVSAAVVVVLGCTSEGGAPSEPFSAPTQPRFATNVDALLKVDKVSYIEQENLIVLTLTLNRGLFGAGFKNPELESVIELRNTAGQFIDFGFDAAVELIKPVSPPTEGLVVIAIAGSWDGNDAQGVPMTGAIMAEWNVQLQFQVGGKTHTLAVATGSGLMEDEG